MIKQLNFFLVISLLLNSTLAIGQTPHLEGTFFISIDNGTIDADLTITNLPKVEDYSFWLNTGLNVEYFRNLDDKTNYGFNGSYNQDISSESFQYYFPSTDNKGKYLPKGIKIKYTGKFPVIKDTLRANEWGDWKGNIAFNGQTFRASEQSAWYPILYDIKNDLVIDKYTYNIKVECKDGKVIYINGSEPQKKKSAVLKSTLPVALLAFVGKYNFLQKDKTFILNGELNQQSVNTLTEMTDTIVKFYESKLSIKYGSSVVYLNSKPVSKKNGWMFVTFPTVAVIGNGRWSLKGYFDEKNYQLKNKNDISFIAHELGHYYFGTYFTPNSTLRWLFLEGITDYISLKATKEILGQDSYDKIVNNYVSQISKEKFIKLDSVTQTKEIGETYRYRYVPLLLTVIEKEIGEDKMWTWLRLILETKNATTDYFFFKTTLTSIIGAEKFSQIEQEYITSNNSKENIIGQLK